MNSYSSNYTKFAAALKEVKNCGQHNLSSSNWGVMEWMTGSGSARMDRKITVIFWVHANKGPGSYIRTKVNLAPGGTLIFVFLMLKLAVINGHVLQIVY